jgi:hypothetical protein
VSLDRLSDGGYFCAASDQMRTNATMRQASFFALPVALLCLQHAATVNPPPTVEKMTYPRDPQGQHRWRYPARHLRGRSVPLVGERHQRRDGRLGEAPERRDQRLSGHIPFRDAIAKRYEELYNFPKVGAPCKVGDLYFI